MSNVNITRSGPEIFQDNDRHDDLDFTTGLREFKPITPRRDWRQIGILFAGVAGLTFVLFVLYHIWKLIYCWTPFHAVMCQRIDIAEPVVVGAVLCITLATIVWSFVIKHSAIVKQQRAIANRINLTLDRFGDQVPADLFDRIQPQHLLKYLEGRYTQATDLQAAIARWQLYKGVNTLSEGTFHYHIENDIVEGKATPIETPTLIPSPSNGESVLEHLVSLGHVDRSGKSLLLGYADDKPVYIELADTGYIGIGGMPRVGKTTTTKLLIAQLGLLGAEILVCDRHGYKKHGLLNHLEPMHKLLSALAIDPNDIISTINYAYGVASDRLADQSTQEYQPLVLVIDEFTGLILDQILDDSTLEKLASMALQSSKTNVHGMLIAHLWDNNTMGRKLGAKMRRTINQRIVHTCDPRDAALLLVPRFAKDVMGLGKGHAIYWGINSQPQTVSIPELHDRDLEYVTQRSDLTRVISHQPIPELDRSRSEIRSADQVNGQTPIDNLNKFQREQLARILLKQGKPFRAVQPITRLDYNRISELYNEIKNAA